MDNALDLIDRIEENGGILSLQASDLRDLVGRGRLKSGVREEIREFLSANGVGHIPEEIPNSQGDYVRLYVKGSKIGRIVSSLLNPNPSLDPRIIEALSGNTDAARAGNFQQIAALAKQIVTLSDGLK